MAAESWRGEVIEIEDDLGDAPTRPDAYDEFGRVVMDNPTNPDAKWFREDVERGIQEMGSFLVKRAEFLDGLGLDAEYPIPSVANTKTNQEPPVEQQLDLAA